MLKFAQESFSKNLKRRSIAAVAALLMATSNGGINVDASNEISTFMVEAGPNGVSSRITTPSTGTRRGHVSYTRNSFDSLRVFAQGQISAIRTRYEGGRTVTRATAYAIPRREGTTSVATTRDISNIVSADSVWLSSATGGVVR